ncbi:Hypothetical predicted protein [Paramuricea clavata]|uniref:Uncharacterized protein n=1 Tax=Paramuricea clavata TaxID=317549 RepID=A0A7D9III9_PARCT|nr:Hypothetical predicted protein [Paramuricea clavata]
MVLKNTLDGKKILVKIGRFIINMLLLFSILKLSVKVNRNANKTQITSGNILICPELVSLPEKLCYVWVSTRDVVFRKYNLPCNNQHRYGLNLQINRKISHASILLLLAGDIATNPGPYKHTNRENQFVKCLALNARSLMSLHKTNIGNNLTDTNIERFQNLVYSEDPDIFCVNETWLNEDIKNSEILHSGYDIFRNDRGSRGGGVLLAIKISSFKSVREIQHGHDLEISMAEITTTSNASLLICSCYRPPNSDHSWLDKFNNFMSDVCSQHSNIVLAGDFNMPRISWDSPEKTSGDFAGLRTSLECLNLDSLITTDDNINHDWQQWKKAFLEAVSQHTPSVRVKGRNYVPWMNSTILHNIKKKNSLRLRIKKSPTPTEYLLEKFKTLRSSIKSMLRNSRSKYFDSICSSRALNPKRFWSLFKFNNKTRNIPQKLSVKVTETKRTSAGNPADIATLFNNYFTSIFTTDPNIENYSPDALPYQSNNTIIEDITLSEADVFSVLHNLDINKAQGPDGIPARLLKETARQIAPSLTALFNKSLNTGVLPFDWKLANVVPVHKKDNKEHVENYRPISLLSLISKALQRCVFNKIKDHVFEQINNGQHGFVPRKSCVTQLIEVFEYIGRELDLGKQVDVMYLDMSKAFDRVSHMQLLKRLRDFGFGGNILNWFRSYLKDRRQQTTVLGATSSALPVTSGVPQGSILGPLLFLLYQNNLPNSINHSKIATFADDTKIYKVINAKVDASAMENDLANFQTSSANSNLLLNTDKSGRQSYSPQRFAFR